MKLCRLIRTKLRYGSKADPEYCESLVYETKIQPDHHYYSGKIPLIHLDLYRLEHISLAKEVFFSEEEEALQSQAILVIEWPELIEPLIENFWKIKISYAKNYGRNYEIFDPKNTLTFS